MLDVRNESSHKRLCRRDALQRLAKKVCAGEDLRGKNELSLLFCDDPFIKKLNRTYRKKNRPTDVLAFEQDPVSSPPPRVLGDIVISLETVERNCHSDRKRMRSEIDLLLCHGLLHLLGYDHATPQEREVMTDRQAHYLNRSKQAAWRFGPLNVSKGNKRRTKGGGSRSVAR